ncbi:MAG: hypothetical protein ABWZ66_10715 [Pyrinomonadaceae bacterium]
MFKRQKSIRLIAFAIALCAVITITFASSRNGGFGLFSSGKASAQERASQQDDKKPGEIPQAKVSQVQGLEEAREADSAPVVTDEPVSTPTQRNDVPDNLLVPLTGTKNIPGDYATLAAAITDLNTQGVGAGGVTFNVIAGNPQTAPVGGYVIGGTGSLVLTSTNATDTVTFTGNGNTVTAGTPQAVGTVSDAVFKLVGADFITIQGFTIQENAGNTVFATSATNTMTEFGVALFYVTTTDGAKNNTIQNNTITLNRLYATTIGIFSTSRTSSTALTATAEATTTGGTNTNNKFYGNNISNANYAIALIGASPAALHETGNDIGGSSAATGNTITNVSTGTAQLSSISLLTGSNYAIFSNHQVNDNISFNSITNAAVASAVTQGGILKNYSVANPTGTITTTINNNTVTITNNPTAATSGAIIGINNQGAAALLATATMSMNNNTVQNCVLGGSTSTTNGITGITNLSLPGTMNMTGNSIINNAITATTATTGINAGITNGGAAGTVNINNNVVRNLASTSASGQVQGIANSGAVTTAININNNQFGNASGGFFSTGTATSGALFGAVNSAGAAAALLTMTGNDIRGITYSGAATAAQNYYNNQVYTGSVNISNNTLTNITVNTTGGVTMIGNSVTRAAGTTANVNNNSIVTQFTKSTAGGTIAFYNSFGSSPSTVTEINTGNNFSNVTFTGATAFIGWRSADGTTPGPRKTITNNTFSNIAGGTSALTSVLYVGFSDSTFATNNVSGNVISNVSAAASISAIFSDGQNQNFFGNTINTLNSTGATAVVRAMELTGATTQNVFRNKIYDIQATDAAGTVNGIAMTAGTTFNVYNNLIGDLRTPAANAANPLIGINATGGTTVNLYYNTVYLNATSTGAVFGSSAVNVTTGPTTVTFRNNIFVNLSTPNTTGLTVAHRRGGTSLTSYGAASNNNDFYAGTPGANNLIFNDTVNSDTTIGAYKTRVSPRDSASFSENPPFLSTSGASANFLHIDPTVATQIESGGAPIGGITDDFDAQTRSVTTPDVGADEFAGIAIDLSAPVITYTNIPSTGLTTNRVLTVTITDATGVATGANLPRIYFKRSTDASYVSTQCVMTGGTAQNGTYDCTINYALLTPPSVTVGDVIQYFVVAQDTAGTPNLGSNPAGATGANVNSITFGGTPNQYTILPAISGNKNVGAGGDYATLTAAVAALNAAEVTAPVTFTLTDATYGAETLPITINANSGSSSTNTVTIKPAASIAPTISGSSASCVINLNGADWTIIDGSNGGGTPAGTSRDMTIANTGTSTTSAVVCITSTGVGTGATNNTVKNTNIAGTTTTATAATLAGVFSGSSTISITSAGADNDNNRIQNNSITKTSYGIYSGGASAANKNAGTIITQNVMNAASPNNITTGGVLANFEDGIQISQNDMSILKHDGTTGTTNTAFGIALGIVPNNAVTTFTGSDVINASITKNKINGVTQLNSTGYSTFGIVVNSVTSGTTVLSNNMVSGVRSPSTASDFSAGILAGGGTGSTTQIYHNSVAMSGARGAGTGFPSYALAINSGNPVVDVKNNIFYNTQTGGAGKSYAIANASSTFTNMTSSFNDLYVSGASAFVGQTGGLGTAGTDRATLGDWNTATGSDAPPNSISIDPAFVNPATDLHIPNTSPAVSAGIAVGSVTTDFDNDPRPASTPDMGADEIVQATAGSFPSGTFYNAILAGSNTLSGNVTITNTLTLTGISNAGANTLTIGCNASVVGQGTNAYVIGSVRKDFCGLGTFTFPVGTTPDNARSFGVAAPEYSPFTANVTALGINPSSLTVNVTDAFIAGSATSHTASRYWDVTEIGDLTADISFTYLDQDVVGVESSYKVLRRESGTTVVYPGGTVNTTTNTGTALAVTNFSQWAAGNLVPTAANVNIGGRVMMPDGMTGMPRAKIVLSGGDLTEPRMIMTNPFGYYSFDNLPAGQTYVLTVGSKQYRFSPRSIVITPDDNIQNADFIARPPLVDVIGIQ